MVREAFHILTLHDLDKLLCVRLVIRFFKLCSHLTLELRQLLTGDLLHLYTFRALICLERSRTFRHLRIHIRKIRFCRVRRFRFRIGSFCRCLCCGFLCLCMF